MRAKRLALTFLLAAGMLTATISSSRAEDPCEYVVKYGDTLIEIAIQLGVTTPDLIGVNDITNPNNIWAGQRLKIPGCPKTPTPVPVTQTHTNPDYLVKIVVPGTTYIANRGDTVCSLASVWGVTTQQLIQENNLPQNGTIYRGQAIMRPIPPKPTVEPPKFVYLHEFGPVKIFPETSGALVFALLKPFAVPAVCVLLALAQEGSSNPEIFRQERIRKAEETWTPPEHLTEDHTLKDAARRLVTWDYLIKKWRGDMDPPDHCVCTADGSKCAICWDDVLIPSATTPGKFYKGGCLILKYKPGMGPSTAIPDVQLIEMTSWFDLEKSEDPFVMSPLHRCPPWEFAPDYNRRKGG